MVLGLVTILYLVCLPRGIPAASLKLKHTVVALARQVVSLPRGIPAASLKHTVADGDASDQAVSSAGNTRGLIEAVAGDPQNFHNVKSSAGNTRGLIEAGVGCDSMGSALSSSAGNTRGLIEA